MRDFNDLIRIGTIGEKIVDRMLKDNGFSIYKPIFSDESNVIDRIAFAPSGASLFYEIKTYPRRWLKPQQGIDQADFEKYRKIVCSNPDSKFFIFFVDPSERKILSLNFKKHFRVGVKESQKVYFDLNLLKPIRDLTDYELARIGWVPASQYKRLAKFFP